MRHSKKIIKLGRKYAHRKFMLANMASSLIEKKRINTTLTKAKALKNFFEPLVTKSKTDTTHNRRIVFRSLRNKEAVSELFRNISKKVGNRPGGYTRVVKLGNRLGDNASMAMIELVDYNQTYKLDKSEKKKSSAEAIVSFTAEISSLGSLATRAQRPRTSSGSPKASTSSGRRSARPISPASLPLKIRQTTWSPGLNASPLRVELRAIVLICHSIITEKYKLKDCG